MADSGLVTEVREALAEALQDPAALLDFAEEQKASVGGDRAALEGGGHKAPVWSSGLDAALVNLCHRTRWGMVLC